MAKGDELRMERAFCRWLESQSVGGKVTSRSEGKRGVPDVVGILQGRRIVFELKTDRPKGEGRKTSERSVDYPTLVGQIVKRMKDETADYAIVFPEAGLPWFKKTYPPHAWDRTRIRLFVWRRDSAMELNADYSEKPAP